MKGICGVNCDNCDMKNNCKGCAAKGGRPSCDSIFEKEYGGSGYKLR